MKATFATQLTLTKFRPSGFDYMRLLLSMGVLGWHTVLMTAGQAAQSANIDEAPWRGFFLLILPVFFALSGFLVSGSMERTKNIADFIGLRVLRILPALCLVVVLSAAVMGPLVTTYSTQDYFSDPQFRHYFLTILGDIHYHLPGVFTNNPNPDAVNGQLWTIPVELECYGILIIPALFGLYKRPKLFLGFVLLVQLAFAARAIFEPVIYSGVPARVMMVCFLFGVIMNMFREKIPFRGDLAFACGILALGLVYVHGGAYFLAAPAAYFTAYLGLQNPKKIWLVSSGDYSYGVYLFAFPIQQLVAMCSALPQIWYVNLLVSLPLTLLMALISWNLVEKRALSYRHQIPQVYRVPVMIYAKTKQRFSGKRPAADRS